MNDEDRNTGVTEARFALTLLTCLLVAIGYIVLLRLGGAKDSPVVTDPDDGSAAVVTAPAPAAPTQTEPVPQVLPIDPPDGGTIQSTAQRPKRTSPLNHSDKPMRR